MEYTLTQAAPEGAWKDNNGQIRTVFIDTANSVWDGATLRVEVSPDRSADFGQESDLEFSESVTAPKNFAYAAGAFRPVLVGAGAATSVRVVIV